MDGRKWSYIFGDEKRFKLRTFQDAESAFGSHRITLGGLRMGSPWISIKLIELDAEKVSAVHDDASYQVLIEPFL